MSTCQARTRLILILSPDLEEDLVKVGVSSPLLKRYQTSEPGHGISM